APAPHPPQLVLRRRPARPLAPVPGSAAEPPPVGTSAGRPKTRLIMAPSQMLDARPIRINGFHYPNGDESGGSMAKIRLVSSGGGSGDVVGGFGGGGVGQGAGGVA